MSDTVADAPLRVAAAVVVRAMSASGRRQTAVWLLICCLLVFSMIALGGVTRLTGSGLSMVQWKPVTGVLPPLSAQHWAKEFDAYKASPEYRLKNYGMSLNAFKRIYWFEFSHRLLGRAIGLVFLAGFAFLLLRGRLERRLVPRLLFLFVLGGLQGVLGWYMVKSGLVDNPYVSQYRLTAHLTLALVIYGLMFRTALDLLADASPERPRLPDTAAVRRLAVGAVLACVLVGITAVSGGFVAGLKAGLAWNTFPLMDGRLVPAGVMALQPAWINLFENAATVQFGHRLLATVTLLTVLAVTWMASRAPLPSRLRLPFLLAGVLVLVQYLLGIATLLARVPVALGASHQANMVLLLTAVLAAHHAVFRRNHRH